MAGPCWRSWASWTPAPSAASAAPPRNAGLDDADSQDHSWGPYLTFIFTDDAEFQAHGPLLREALAEMPEEIDGVRRVDHTRRLPNVPSTVRDGVETLVIEPDRTGHLPIAAGVVVAIKALLLDLYRLDVGDNARLAWFAHRVRATIQDDAVRQHASLDW